MAVQNSTRLVLIHFNDVYNVEPTGKVNLEAVGKLRKYLRNSLLFFQQQRSYVYNEALYIDISKCQLLVSPSLSVDYQCLFDIFKKLQLKMFEVLGRL